MRVSWTIPLLFIAYLLSYHILMDEYRAGVPLPACFKRGCLLNSAHAIPAVAFGPEMSPRVIKYIRMRLMASRELQGVAEQFEAERQ